jgi:hypothetical protein
LQLREFKVIGRMMPTEKNPKPPLYQMRIFAPDYIVAKSRFWYHVTQLRKMKKTMGEIVLCQRVRSIDPFLSQHVISCVSMTLPLLCGMWSMLRSRAFKSLGP